ncbi:putative Cystatin domain-containing protein [Medicago truncatula]|uniref:Cysteine proteinase inhibitor n=1 Tax=Medicago truncatula TaxID=3880 RepID=G7KD43_MEDTR|nr:putative cysteine proteinase inhibitor 7 [Medicago truncatula]AET00371.1 cysteine proteinase inhibitor [Medicago truncatula]RHN57678.1 putative Cystatin domain-containing protein [Medicago truncatula]
MTLQSPVFILIVLLVLSATNQALTFIDWSPVDINDPHVVEIAKFAVTEFNKRITIEKLTFENVIHGESKNVVDGTVYRLTFSAHGLSTSYKYRAIVFEKPSEHYRKLASFELVHA